MKLERHSLVAALRAAVVSSAVACAAVAGTIVALPSAAGASPVTADPVTPALRLPAPVTRTLPNGMRVVVFTVPRLPVVQLQLQVPAGSRYEADSLPGVAALSTDLLAQGTTSRTAQQFTMELAQLGATFSPWTGRDFALVAVGARAQAFESTLELLSDAVINPSFGGDDFEGARDAWVQRLLGQAQNLAPVADERVAHAAFGPHPYGHSPYSHPTELAATSRSAVQGFHRDRWRPDRAVLVIAGDVTPDRAFAAATEWFGRWAGRTAPDAVVPAVRPSAGVQVVDVPTAPRVELRVALAGPGLADPAFPAWYLAETGFEAGRVPAGARVALVTARDASLIVLSAGAPREQAAETARRLVDAVRAFAASPPAGAELEALRRRAVQRYPLTIETLGAFTNQWQSDDFSGLPADEPARFVTRLATADLASVHARLAAMPVVLALGPAAALRGPLAALGTVEVSPLELTTQAEAAAVTLPAPTALQLRRGRELIAATVLAHGGAAKLAGVKSIVIEGKITFHAGGSAASGLFSAVRIEPERLSYATKMLKLETRQVLDGGHGWAFVRADSLEIHDLDSTQVGSLRTTFHSDLVHELRIATAAGAGAVRRGTETIGGRRCDLVDFDSPLGGRQRFAIDALTHRIVAIDGGLGAGGVWHDRRKLADFKPVHGLLLPFSEERFIDGQRVQQQVASLVGVNEPTDSTLFERARVRDLENPDR